MVFNVILSNISGTSCRSVLLVQETILPGENPTWRKSLTNFITYTTPHHERDSNSQL